MQMVMAIPVEMDQTVRHLHPYPFPFSSRLSTPLEPGLVERK